MPPGIGFINPQIIMRAMQQRAPQQGPGGLTGFLQKPGIRDALLATGSALLAQSDQPGSLGGALGRALPMGVQAYQQGQQSAALDEAFADAPESMRRLMAGLSMTQRQGLAGNLLMQQMAPRAPQGPVTVGANQRLVDPNTGETIVGAMEAPPSFEYRNLPDGRVGVFSEGAMVNTFGEAMPEDAPTFSDVGTFRREFNSQIEPFDQVAEAYQKVQASGAKPNPTAADDVSLVFGYMKIVDPGSTVREGEQATARDAAGVPDRVVALYNRLVNGQTLAPEQRANFVQAARELVQSQVPIYEQRANYYRDIANRAGINPSDVIRNPFAGTDLMPRGPGAFDDLIPGGG